MAFFTPKVHYNPNVQLITVPNKNVQSYFMKSETSYFVSEEDRITDPQDILTLVITTNEIILVTDKIKVLVVNKCLYNNIKIDNYEIEIVEDPIFFNTLFVQSNFNPAFHSLEIAMDYLQTKLMTFDVKWKDRLVNLVFGDLFTRSEIVSMVNMFVRYMNVKGIMLTPYSLAVCFGLNINAGSVFLKNEMYVSVGFVDDYTYLYGNKLTTNESIKMNASQDSKEIEEGEETSECKQTNEGEETDGSCKNSTANIGADVSHSVSSVDESSKRTQSNDKTTQKNDNLLFTYDSIDFVEEFARQSVGIGKKTYYCHFCDYKIENVDDITEHVKMNHGNEISDDFEDVINDFYTEKREDIELRSVEPEENYNAILKFIGGDKEKKVAVNKVFIGVDGIEKYRSEGDKIVECDRLTVVKGMWAFLSIECSKELWMSEKEWMTAGLRILKEKLLFYI